MSEQKRSAFDALSPQHQSAVTAWVAGANHTEVATACGVHRSQASRWWKRGDIQAAVRELRGESWARRRLKLEAHSDIAVETLGKLIHDESVSAETRLRAAEICLKLAGHTVKATAADASDALDDRETEARLGALLGVPPKRRIAEVLPLRAADCGDTEPPGGTLQ